jgi:hypothetical protein
MICEFSRNSPIYDRNMPLTLLTMGQAENQRILNLRLFNGVRSQHDSGNNQQERILHYEVSNNLIFICIIICFLHCDIIY